MKLAPFVFAMCMLFAGHSSSSPAGEPQLSQLSWLSGCWKGTGLGGEVQECWVRSGDDVFTGVFQLVEDGQQQFSEIVMIAEFDGKPGMRVKHFDSAFNQWASDKGVGVTFPFINMEDNYIQFDGLRYELIDDVLHVTLDMKKGDEIQQMSFVFSRN